MEVAPLEGKENLRMRADVTHEFNDFDFDFEGQDQIPKAVVLFGRMWEDKTNLANALIRGGVYESGAFKLKSQGDGNSLLVQTQSTKGWSVTDTIGGLSSAEAQTTSKFEAVEIVTKFLMNLRGEYSHIIYTHNALMASTTVDLLLWLAFEQIFAGAEEAYVVLYTGGDEKWLETHRSVQPDYLRPQTVLVTGISSKRILNERRPFEENSKGSVETLEKDLQEVFERRKRRYSRPFISDMDEEMLRQKAETLLISLAETIQSRLHPNFWMKVACKFSSFFPLVWLYDQIDLKHKG
ncbi:hypothetical protein R1sor_013983 [Riccia sorocarpa]|uniref:G domain-containing protein n=1 Tax=Riccia sorocarpa TaxID=122646 RepID=A0ABD3HB03_9MARC